MGSLGHNGGPSMLPRFDGGWVAIHRSIRDHWLVGFGNPVKPMDPEEGSMSRAEAWIDLIMECRYEAGTVMNGGRKMEIQPGQLVGAVSFLAARWNWTPQTVRTFLDKLEEDGMIEREHPGIADKNNKQKGKQATVITVCNYSEYQISKNSEQQANQQASNEQPTSKQHASNNNTKDNKGTKEQANKPSVDAVAETKPKVEPEVRAPQANVEPMRSGFDDPHGPAEGEIEGLNGSTTMILTDIARCLNNISPDLDSARSIVIGACNLYGGDAVKAAHLDMMADVQTRKLRAPSIKAWNAYVGRAGTKAKADPKGGRSNSKHVPRDEGVSFLEMVERDVEKLAAEKRKPFR